MSNPLKKIKNKPKKPPTTWDDMERNQTKITAIELTDEQLAAVSGGVVKGWDEPPNCMYCGSDNTEFTGHGVKCHNCGKEFSGLLG